MICVCFCNQPLQHGWQISVAMRWPNSFGKGEKPTAGRFSPQCLHLIVSAILSVLLGERIIACYYIALLFVRAWIPNSVIRRCKYDRLMPRRLAAATLFPFSASSAVTMSRRFNAVTAPSKVLSFETPG